jgi:hypothetical protein
MKLQSQPEIEQENPHSNARSRDFSQQFSWMQEMFSVQNNLSETSMSPETETETLAA